VDDDAEVRELVSLALATIGCTVVTTPNGPAALELLRKEAPSVVLLGLSRLDGDGATFTDAYRRLPEPRARLIVLTAPSEAPAAAAPLGAAASLSKPFDLADVLTVVERCMAGP
jgi:CheY-like chemotaxis protein